MSTTDDDIDAKLAAVSARVTERNAERTAAARTQLEAIRIGDITAAHVARLCRETFDAKLTYLGPADRLQAGHPYNFDLRGPSSDGSADGPVQQPPAPAAQPGPYRGKAYEKRIAARGSRGFDRAAGDD